MHFAFTFSEYSRLLFPKRLWKWASTISFRKYKRKVVLLVIYLFNYDSPKSTFFMLNVAFDVRFWRSEHSFCYINWNFSFLAIIKLQEHFSFCSVFWSKFFKKVILLHHGDNNFLSYFDICNQIRTFNNNLKGWRNDNISNDVCYKLFIMKMLQLLYYNFFMTKIADKPWQIMLHVKPFRHCRI